ncbi:hypothetical protein B9Z55_003714 [Caenorhabditis nigoni]|nr:hypothetical protein B9Z55_003714 [Caenorhabditis nigoni]
MLKHPKFPIKKLADIRDHLFWQCEVYYQERPWYEWGINKISGLFYCKWPLHIIWTVCIKAKFSASSCEWALREALEEFCNNYPAFFHCDLIPTKPPPRTTTVSTTTSTTTPSTTTKQASTEDRLANMIMYATIGGSIFLLLICIILYIFYRQVQADRRAREMREARMWGKDWMDGVGEGLEEGFKEGVKGWTSSATSGTTGGTTGTKKDKKKKKKKTTGGTTSKTETTGTWL